MKEKTIILNSEAKYIPAFGVEKLTRLYDRLIRWTMPELQIKSELIHQSRLQTGEHILDLGCGTGTLLLLINIAHPEVELFGMDGDPKILKIAHEKAVKAHVNVNLTSGMAFNLPYNGHSFERVFSTLVLHHLTTKNQQLAMQEVFRVLKPNGEFHIADFGKPHNQMAFLISLVVQRLEEVSDNIKGSLPEMLIASGFESVEETAQYMTVFGTVRSIRARKQK